MWLILVPLVFLDSLLLYSVKSDAPTPGSRRLWVALDSICCIGPRTFLASSMIEGESEIGHRDISFGLDIFVLPSAGS